MTRSKANLALLATLLVVTILAAVTYMVLRSDAENRPRPEDQALLRQGAEIYAQNCAVCHGANLEGEPDWQSGNPDGTLKAPPHDASGHTWHHPDDLLFRITKYGTAKAAGLENFVSNMPAFEGILSDREIFAVLTWIKAQWPKEIRERQETFNERQRAGQQ
jgi:mono/diheme cytochrome c family protein